MKKFFFQCICALSLTYIGATASFAQDTTMPASGMSTPMLVPPPLFSGNGGFRTWSIGVHGGILAPFAAIGGRNDFSKWLPDIGYGAYVKYQISHGLGIQADFLRGSLKANNDRLQGGAPPVSPYSSFQTDVNWGVSLSGVVTLGNINWSQLHTSIQPYVSVGAGGINFSPHLTTSAGGTFNYNGGTSVTDLYIPVGFGLRANLSNSINLDLGYTMGFVDGDDMDGYQKPPTYQSDKFSYAHIGLEFILGDSKRPQLARHNAPAQLARETREQNDALRAALAASEARYNARLAELSSVKDDIAKMKMDSDGDGVADFFDKCPNTPKGVKVDGSGCALPTPPPPAPRDTVVRVTNTYVITEEDKKVVNEAIRNLEFDFGKATIRARSLPYLDRVAALLVKKGFSLKLAGHTDNIGSDAANMKLSKDRAESVKNYLISQGANNGKIEATGYGETQPIATNKTDAGRQKNRRVEFTLF